MGGAVHLKVFVHLLQPEVLVHARSEPLNEGWLLHDLIARLRLDEGTKAPISKAEAEHGELRRKQGYTVAMAVQESRLLQVSRSAGHHIFHAAQKHEQFGIRPAPSPCCDHRGRRGCAIEGADDAVHGFMAADAAKEAKGK